MPAATLLLHFEDEISLARKLADAAGGLMLQSTGFEQPKACGGAIARLQTEGAAALASLGQHLQPGVTPEALDAAMAALRDAKG